MAAERAELPLRIVMTDPLADVAVALQRGQGNVVGLEPPANLKPSALVFEFNVRVGGVLPDGRPRLLGPFVQGPPTARFVYLTVGTYAGQVGSPWSRRVKVPLAGIDRALVEALTPGGRLEARFHGRGRDGGPAAASVKLAPPGWTVSPA